MSAEAAASGIPPLNPAAFTPNFMGIEEIQADDSNSDYSDTDADNEFYTDHPADAAGQADRDAIAREFREAPPGRNYFVESLPPGLPTATTPGFEWLAAFPSAVKAAAAGPPAVAPEASSSVAAQVTAAPTGKRERAQDDASPKAEKEDPSDPLFDDAADDDDEKWVNSKRFEAISAAAGVLPGTYPAGPPPGYLASLKTDAVLSCPFCFTVLTYVCQQHERFENQYRSIFVQHCAVNRAEALRYPQKGGGKSKRRGTGAGDAPAAGEASGSTTTDDVVYPVTCSGCGTHVGVYEATEDVYHFVDVMPSLS